MADVGGPGDGVGIAGVGSWGRSSPPSCGRSSTIGTSDDGAAATSGGGTVTEGTDGVILFLDSGWIPAPDHPTFSVTPEMIELAMRWPAALKRENLLGTTTPA